jgi:acetyltransferase-like isoleucine patch superfamily enzyme
MPVYDIPGVRTFDFTKIIGLEHIVFGRDIIIDDFVLIYATNTIRLGNNIHIASFVSITGGGTLTMEDFTGFASGTRVVTGSDDFKDWGFGNPTTAPKYRNIRRGHIHVGRFAIVGANSVIMPDVTIGEGVTVGAGSVVTRDLQPWGIYIGNKRVGERNREGILEHYAEYLRDTASSDQ